MKKVILLFSFILSIFILSSCKEKTSLTTTQTTTISTTTATTQTVVSTTTAYQEIDYAGSVKLNMDSDSLKAEVTIKQTVDGDTTHFYINTPSFDNEILKARYIAVNTPESTGKIEPYGKKASNFTKEKLLSASSIIIESDTNQWNADSTGDRYLVWVWYKTDEMSEYRNLNIELLQNGLAIASNSGQNRYGEICLNALAQAKKLKLNVMSGQKDPDHYYGSAVELTLKELRTNIEKYNGIKVAFEGVIYEDNNQSVYIEEYDEETDLYYGISVYYGFGTTGFLLEILEVGNRVRMVGTVSYYEAGGTYQVSGLTYNVMKPNHADNVQKIEGGYSGAYKEYTAEEFSNKKVTVEIIEDEESIEKEFSLAELSLNTTISMNNLKVVSVYTTNNEDSSSKGAMTLTCESNGIIVKIRTIVFRDANGELITQDAYLGKNISVRGMIEYFDGYQIKVFRSADITINE